MSLLCLTQQCEDQLQLLVASLRMNKTLLTPAECVRIEANALQDLADRISGEMAAPVEDAIARIVACADDGGRVVATGLGKSGHIAQKFVGTLNSLGVPAQFLHAGEASHGDAGMLTKRDVVIVLTYSGETDEIVAMLTTVKARASALIAICGSATSTVAKAADLVLDVGIDMEACGMNLAPTTSTAAMLALTDALAIESSRRRNFRAEDFAVLHPGGRLGKRLQRVSDLMHFGDRMPRVSAETSLSKVIHEMSEKRLGMTTVLDVKNMLLGVISDGDLRRLLEHEGGTALDRIASDVMHPHPTWIADTAFASQALAMMEEKKITAIVACNADGVAVGVLHLHDLWEK